MKRIVFYSLIAIGLIMTSCQPNATQQTSLSIPSLLDRPEKIQNGKEWENVHNTYTQAKVTLMADQSDWEQYLQLAQIFMLEARVTGEHGHYYPAALEVLNKVLTNEKEASDLRFQALSLRASVQLSQHEFEKALSDAKAAIAINNFNAQIYGVLTDALVELGQYDEAVKMADQMISIRPDLRSYSRVSYLREIYGDVDGAIEAMEMAVQAAFPGQEQSAWTRLTLGDVYNTYGQLEKAEQQYQAILHERENYPFAIAALADVAMQNGDLAKAEKLLNEAANIIPEVGFYIQLADLYQQTDRLKKYHQTLEEISLMLQDDVDSGHNMNLEYADLHLNYTKDFDQALAFAKLEYDKRPENIDVNRMLAKIYSQLNDLAKAEKYLAKAEITQSKHPELLELKRALAFN